MVEVFKTNVDDKEAAGLIELNLKSRFPECKINFDLEDCDKILRVAGEINPVQIIELVNMHGFYCEALE